MGQLSKVEAATRIHWNAEQERLASCRESADRLDWSVGAEGNVQGLDRVAGVDLSFFPDARHAVAAVVVLSFPKFEVLYEHCATVEVFVPYVPGYLAFREVPPLADMLLRLEGAFVPQAILVDGNGAYHPRKCGAATHLGIIVDTPTIGIAKDVLMVGSLGVRKAEKVASMLDCAGAWAPFAEEGAEPLAAILKPGHGKRTLVVSPGHRVCLNTAVALTKAVCLHDIPEPIRQADLRSRRAVAAWLCGTPLPALTMGMQARKRQRVNGSSSGGSFATGVENVSAGTVLLQLVDKHAGKDVATPCKPQVVWRPKITCTTAIDSAAAVEVEAHIGDNDHFTGVKKSNAGAVLLPFADKHAGKKVAGPGKPRLVWQPKITSVEANAPAAAVEVDAQIRAEELSDAEQDLSPSSGREGCCSLGALRGLARWLLFG